MVLCLACGSDQAEQVRESTSVRAKPPAGQVLAAEVPRSTSVDGERAGGDDAPSLENAAEPAEGREEPATGPLGDRGDGDDGGSADGPGGESETGVRDDQEGARKSRVKVRLRKALGSVDRGAISRVIAQVAKDCHRRALREDPETAGRLELEFTLIGDYRGPVQLKIGGEETLPGVAVCLRKGMAARRWPTGHLDGVGIFEARVDLSVDSGGDSG